MDFSGKTILITGGGSGMGRQAARNLANAGAQVAIFDVNEAGMRETAEGLPGIHSWVVDITDAQAVATAVAEVEAKLGPVERVYNAAAIMPFGKLLEQDVAIMHKMMAINYGGLVNISRAVLPGMVQRGRGDFISFASMAGLIPTLLTGAYSASKAAVAMYTEILYHENRDSGVRFACVCPPMVNTPLLEQGRATAWPKMLEATEMLSPQDVLDAIEAGLESDRFWVYPGKQTRFGAWMRRWFPGLVWKQVHQTEGF